jgi:hypothetical protein
MSLGCVSEARASTLHLPLHTYVSIPHLKYNLIGDSYPSIYAPAIHFSQSVCFSYMPMPI